MNFKQGKRYEANQPYNKNTVNQRYNMKLQIEAMP